MIVCADKANQLIMKKRGAFFLAFTSVIGLGFHSGPNTPARPNIIFMLADDLGWADLGCYGNTFHETPNLDKLAKEGMQFTRAYSACAVCSPTRASIMTGKYPARLHITDWIAGHNRPYAKLKIPEWPLQLPLEERTIAEEYLAAAAVGEVTVNPETVSVRDDVV